MASPFQRHTTSQPDLVDVLGSLVRARYDLPCFDPPFTVHYPLATVTSTSSDSSRRSMSSASAVRSVTSLQRKGPKP